MSAYYTSFYILEIRNIYLYISVHFQGPIAMQVSSMECVFNIMRHVRDEASSGPPGDHF